MATKATAEASLRAERNRFVAFAFTAAEVFLEIDSDFAIRYAAGATQSLLGRDEAELAGAPLSSLSGTGVETLIRLLQFGQVHGRFGPRRLHLEPPAPGHPVTVEVSGTFMAQGSGCYYLALRRALGPAAGPAPTLAAAAPAAEAVESFVDTAARLVEAAGAGAAPPAMTLLELDGLDALHQRLAPNQIAQLERNMAGFVDSHAMQDGGAVRLASDKFGLLSDPDIDLADLPGGLEQMARAIDPEGQGVTATVGQIELASSNLQDRDNARALQYAISRFCDENDDFTLQDLAEGYQEILDSARLRIAALRAAVTGGNFDVVFQPIVELKTRQLHHYEALVRLPNSVVGASPGDFINFAEDTGLISEFDIAMCGRVVERLNKAQAGGEELHIAVNLSGSSLENDAFIQQLSELVRNHAGVARQLMFEITETVEMRNLGQVNNYITWLRQRGHKVCLDDFGSGAAAFQYLRAVDVDYVKIDGSYVRSALEHHKDQAFLRSVATLCQDLGISTIAEMVEDEKIAAFLRRIGVTHGQGYLYGKPSGGLRAVKPPPD